MCKRIGDVATLTQTKLAFSGWQRLGSTRSCRSSSSHFVGKHSKSRNTMSILASKWLLSSLVLFQALSQKLSRNTEELTELRAQLRGHGGGSNTGFGSLGRSFAKVFRITRILYFHITYCDSICHCAPTLTSSFLPT